MSVAHLIHAGTQTKYIQEVFSSTSHRRKPEHSITMGTKPQKAAVWQVQTQNLKFCSCKWKMWLELSKQSSL